jgi:hypothetical protein
LRSIGETKHNTTPTKRTTHKRPFSFFCLYTDELRTPKDTSKQAKQASKTGEKVAFYPLQVDTARTQKNNNPQSPIKAHRRNKSKQADKTTSKNFALIEAPFLPFAQKIAPREAQR